MKTIDQMYVDRLIKLLQSLLKHLKRKKPSSAFSTAEIRALSNFGNRNAPKGSLAFVQSLDTQTSFIPLLRDSARSSIIYFIQTVLTKALRLSDILRHGDPKKLKLVIRELKAHNIMEMERKSLNPQKDRYFEELIVGFLNKGNNFNDHNFKNIAMLPGMYLELLDHYWRHRIEISTTRQWYDFLVISNYMLYGMKLELLQLQKLKKR